jgi:hypothetical protein
VFDPLPWGRCTVKANGDTTTLYFHVFDWPAERQLVLPAFANEPLSSAALLGSTEPCSPYRRTRKARVTFHVSCRRALR